MCLNRIARILASEFLTRTFERENSVPDQSGGWSVSFWSMAETDHPYQNAHRKGHCTEHRAAPRYRDEDRAPNSPHFLRRAQRLSAFGSTCHKIFLPGGASPPTLKVGWPGGSQTV